jgi:galactose mutarotase-like enzyme
MSTPETFPIILSSNRLRCEILPEFGGKIRSLKWLANGIELLQPPLGPYRRQDDNHGPVLAFSQSDAGGWDECLPSVAACRVGEVSIPDHGDIWRYPSQAQQTEDTNVKIVSRAASLPLSLTRTLHLSEASLEIHYAVENIGSRPFPYLWSAHPLFSVDVGDRLRLPAEVHRLRVENSKHHRLGSSGTTQSWPITRISDGSTVDISTAQSRSADVGDKVFASLSGEGWAEIVRPSAGIALRIEFDPKKIPYLGLWLCYGGWPENSKPGSRQQCIALEPTTADCDALSEAIKTGRARILAPQEQHEWTITLQVKGL